MKTAILLISVLITGLVQAQQNGILFQRLLGGSQQDGVQSLIYTPDGGYLAAGFTASADGDIQQAPLGDFDVSLFKLNANGGLEWQRSYGGTSSDQNAKVKLTPDSGYFFTALTISDDGMITTSYGGYDFWVVKVDSTGNLMWQHTFGGSESDEPQMSLVAADGSLLVCGRTFSSDFDATDNHGNADAWVIKLDAAGNLIWKKCYGGTQFETAFDIKETADGNYIMYGSSNSTDNDVSASIGLNDLWIVKINAADGSIIWERSLGGTADDAPQRMILTNDGGYAFSGVTYSADSMFSQHQGNGDGFILKTDSLGYYQWSHTYGGSAYEIAKGLVQLSDGSYVITSSTTSNDFDVSGNHGSWDGLVINIDSAGNFLWQRVIGGTQLDVIEQIYDAGNNEFLLIGNSSSSDGDVSGGHGSSEGWMVKIKPVNKVTGIVYIDLNNNQTKDGGEPAFTKSLVVTQSANDQYASLPAANGRYVNYADSGSFVSLLAFHPYFNSLNADTSLFAGYGETDTVDFPVTVTPGITDASVQLFPLTPVRPGFKSSFQLIYANEGTDAISGNVVLVKPSLLTLDVASVAPDYLSGDTLIWNFNSLPLLSFNVITLSFNNAGPPDVNLGDSLIFTAEVITQLTDTFPSDNYQNLMTVVIGSFDPNDKTCLQGSTMTTAEVSNGEWLDYIIRFQNTGTDTAFNVKITDVLDPSLDHHSFQLRNTSHTCTADLDGNTLNFYFNNILLPDSNINESGSHGYISYRIKPLSIITAGAVINNTADIYFDFNEPVITNTVTTLIVVPANISEQEVAFLGTYPNPASSEINIQFESVSDVRFTLTDAAGKTHAVAAVKSGNGLYTISMEKFASGIYILSMTNGTSVATAKIVKAEQ